MLALAVTTIAILSVMALALARALKADTVYDRILGVNMFGTKTVLFIAAIGFLSGRPDFLDIAIVYALINFIGMVAVLRFFEYTATDDSRDSSSASEDQP